MTKRLFSPLNLSGNAKGILFINTEGIIAAYNETAEELLHVPRKTALNQPFAKVFEDELLGFSVRQALFDKDVPSLGKRIAITERPIEVDATFVQLTPSGAAPTTEGLIILVKDISELKRRQAITARNERMKELGRMAALAAHEIRNPLGGIKGFASLLQRDLKENQELYKLASYIVEGTENLNRILNKILDYTKPLQLKLENRDLAVIAQELIVHLKADAEIDTRVHFHLASTQQPIYALVDSNSLKSALLNLAYNAIHAMPKGGELTLAISETLYEAVIKVIDTGVGIPKENLNKMFSPYFTTRADGHGFGLAEVHKIIHAHHGEIEFSSKEGVGTTFVIHLPKAHS